MCPGRGIVVVQYRASFVCDRIVDPLIEFSVEAVAHGIYIAMGRIVLIAESECLEADVFYLIFCARIIYDGNLGAFVE